MTNLYGKIAVVTGASRGLGKRIAVRLGQLNATVVLLARTKAGLESTQQQLTALGARSMAIPADLSKPESVAQVKEVVEHTIGTPSILVNAAGICGPLDLIKDTDPVKWVETIMINTIAPYLTCRAFVNGMIKGGWGRIINVTSAASLHEPGPTGSAYSTSKCALNRFTRHLGAELSGTGVTANVIHPGEVKTDMWADIKAEAPRLGSIADGCFKWIDWVEETGGDDPEKAADLVERLISDNAADVNGQFLWIEGGLQSPIPSWGKPYESQPWQK